MAPATPDPNLARLRAIENYIRAGRLREAAAALAALRASAPGDVRRFLAEALLAHAAKNPKAQIAALREAVAAAPDWLLAQLELARALSHEGQHDDAVTMVNRAVERAPADETVLRTAVQIATAAADLPVARRHLETAWRLWPQNAGIGRELGLCLVNLRAFEAAQAHWRAMAQAHPDDPIVIGNLGASLIELGRRDEGIAMLERALAILPD
ncbi:MAG TPA: tetratricopeptide repeat protein, partial [Rudaea sp.]